MDQDAFRRTYREVNECFCAFEKSVLMNQCHCSQAERFCIAEREGVHCLSEEGQTRCLHVLNLLREQAKFALRTHEEKAILPHGKAIRIQIGGMRGIRLLVTPNADDSDAIEDIHGILDQAEQMFNTLEALPFSDIMPSIAAYKGRTRRRKRDRKT